MRTPKIETDFTGKVCLRIFSYTKNENPTIVGYYWGSIVIVRPVMVVNSKGKLAEKYEFANKPIINDEELERLITNSEDSLITPFLSHLVTDEEFDKLDKQIVSYF